MTTESYIANAGFDPESNVSNQYGGRSGREGSMVEQIMNASLLQRGAQIQKLLDPRRDIDDECGFPKNHEITMAMYQYLYDREAVATRVIEVLPDESWKVQPMVFEPSDDDSETQFEKALTEMTKTLRSGDDEESWYQGDSNQEGNPIWEYLHRVDKLSGIGSFGVVLLGFNDVKTKDDLRNPVKPSESLELTHVRVFSESQVDIRKLETQGSRNGRPVEYHITLSDPNEDSVDSTGTILGDIDVHWTRVIHIADMLGSSELFAVPRLRPVYNNILNLRKLYAGSAEMYWQGAFPGISFETHPQLGTDVKMDTASIRTAMTNYRMGLQREITTTGMSANSLAPQVVDPSKQIDVQLDAICIKLGIPKRIFLGSERGELASSQDSKSWDSRLKHRQMMYLTPRVIAPLINRLIWAKVLPTPPNGFGVQWPELEKQDGEKKALIFKSVMEALSKYVQGDVENLIAPEDLLTREEFLGFSQEDADEMMNRVEEHIASLPDEPEEDVIIPQQNPNSVKEKEGG